MFDIAWSELALIAAVALIVIGPKDLPRVMRTAGQWVRKARGMAAEFQRNLDDMMREAELDEIRKEVEKVSPTEFRAKLEKEIGVAAEFQRNLDDMMREAELDEIRKEVEKVSPAQFKESLEKLVDAKGIETAMEIVDPKPVAPDAEPVHEHPEPTPAPVVAPAATPSPEHKP